MNKINAAITVAQALYDTILGMSSEAGNRNQPTQQEHNKFNSIMGSLFKENYEGDTRLLEFEAAKLIMLFVLKIRSKFMDETIKDEMILIIATIIVRAANKINAVPRNFTASKPYISGGGHTGT